MKKKSQRKKLVEKLDAAVSLYIRKRDGECVVCGSTQQLTNGHVFSRDSYSTRWDISEDGNCHCQCWPCNYRHEYDTYPYHTWYQDRFGREAFDDLHLRYHTRVKFKDFQLQEMIDDIKQKIKELT